MCARSIRRASRSSARSAAPLKRHPATASPPNGWRNSRPNSTRRSPISRNWTVCRDWTTPSRCRRSSHGKRDAMSADELAELSLIEVGREISRRAVSPVEVVRAALDRIDRYDPVLNAYVTVCREQALRDAEMAEREIVNSDYRGPLHGVPVSVKDLFDMRGFRTTAG